MGKVNQEMAEHGDMVMLPVSHSPFPEAEPRDESFFPAMELEDDSFLLFSARTKTRE